MAKYIILYKMNTALAPTDPQAALAQTETTLAMVDDLLKKGRFKEIGVFAPGEGYVLAEYPSREEAFRDANLFFPRYLTETHEVIPWDKAKEIVLANMRALFDMMKK